MNTEVATLLRLPPEQVMAQNGKSFYFASLIFTPQQRHLVSELYTLCRYIDDVADELPLEQAKNILSQISHSINETEHLRQISPIIDKLEKQGVKREYIQHLLSGAQFDVSSLQIESEQDLLRYCYKVAGVVGLMMCPILGVQIKEAQPHAIDLGIAMQLTNICRDVKEDALNNRTYLPLNVLESKDITLDDLQNWHHTPANLKPLIAHYLKLADQFYESAYNGLAYIPLRPRICILVAGEVYRAIGKKIEQDDYAVLSGRTYLNLGEKLWVASKALLQVFRPRFWKAKGHSEKLHLSLQGLPGVHKEHS